MTRLLNTVIATAFATSCFVGVSLADSSGTKDAGKSSMKHMQNSDELDTDGTTTGSIKCDNSNANINSGCDKPGHLKQEERMEIE